jgi:hypothetical protein
VLTGENGGLFDESLKPRLKELISRVLTDAQNEGEAGEVFHLGNAGMFRLLVMVEEGEVKIIPTNSSETFEAAWENLK